MFSNRPARLVAAGVAAVAVTVGGFAIGNASSSNGAASTPSAHHRFGPSQATPTGQIPQNWAPGTGTIITGSAADRAKAAALDADYQGTVNRVLKLSDGTYVVHLIATSGPHHVFVSGDFKVTGSE